MTAFAFAFVVLAFEVADAALKLPPGTKAPTYGIPWLYKGLAVWAFMWGGIDAFGIGANDGERPLAFAKFAFKKVLPD